MTADGAGWDVGSGGRVRPRIIKNVTRPATTTSTPIPTGICHDVRLARGLVDEELVVREAARVRGGADDQLTVRADEPLAAPERFFVKLRRREVSVYPPGIPDPVAGKIVRRHGPPRSR